MLEAMVQRLVTPELWSLTELGLCSPPVLNRARPRRRLRPVSLASPAPPCSTSTPSSTSWSTSWSTIPLLRVSTASPGARSKEEASWSSTNLLQAGQNQRSRSSTTSAIAVEPSAMQLVWKWNVQRSHMISCRQGSGQEKTRKTRKKHKKNTRKSSKSSKELTWSAVSSAMPQMQPILTVTSP